MIKFIDGIYYRKRIAAGKTYVKILHGNYFYQHYIDAHHTDFNQQERNTYQKQEKLFHILFSTIAIAAFCEWMGSCLQGTGGACVVGIYVRDFRLHNITWTETAYIHMRISTGYTWWHISAPSHIWYMP